jgi:hypothetical protein
VHYIVWHHIKDAVQRADQDPNDATDARNKESLDEHDDAQHVRHCCSDVPDVVGVGFFVVLPALSKVGCSRSSTFDAENS